MAKAVKVDGVLQLAHALVCLEGGRCVSLSDWSTRSTKSNSRCGAAHYGSSSVNRVGWSSKQRPRGPMDKASAHGAGDCRFESCRGQPHCQKTHVVMFSWSASTCGSMAHQVCLLLLCVTLTELVDRSACICQALCFATCRCLFFALQDYFVGNGHRCVHFETLSTTHMSGSFPQHWFFGCQFCDTTQTARC